MGLAGPIRVRLLRIACPSAPKSSAISSAGFFMRQVSLSPASTSRASFIRGDKARLCGAAGWASAWRWGDAAALLRPVDREYRSPEFMYRILMCAAAGAVIFAMPAKADERLKFRVVQYVATAQIQQIGDVPNHIQGLIRYPGIASFPDGSTAKTLTFNAADGIAGPGGGGTVNGYENMPEARKYKITRRDLEILEAQQGGCCDICGQQFDVLCVDHCHTSGRVRGLLCSRHNLLLGLAQDSTTILWNAFHYLDDTVPSLPQCVGTTAI
jgi:hypothetical protein